MSIKVLIVDDIPQTRENLRKLLSLEPDIEIVGMAATGEEGIELARKLRPDIVLMDINLPGIDGITATEIVSREVPEAQVIMISVQGEPAYMRRAMLAGAREFLIKPFSSDELISAIRRVYELGKTRQVVAPVKQPAVVEKEKPRKEGKIISAFSPKGGVGTSTIAANLAVALSSGGSSRVALVDLNLQFGSQDVIFNLQPRRHIADLVSENITLDEETVTGAMLAHPSGVKVLLAPPRPELADFVTPELVKKVLAVLKGAFDYVIVDCTSFLNDLTITALEESDFILLITTPELTAIKGAKLFFQVLEVLKYPTNNVLLVLNKDDRRSGISAKDIQASLKHPIEVILPNDEARILLSVNRGVPIYSTERGSAFSEGISRLAGKIQQKGGSYVAT
jgi:pilus assembly protein CpaE